MNHKTVNIAEIPYHIREIKGLATQHNLLGQVIYQEQIIKLDAYLPKEKKQQVAIHEILHAIYNEAGIDEQDEDTINRVAIVLYQVLKTNDLYDILEIEVD